jgi:hypothetical protein
MRTFRLPKQPWVIVAANSQTISEHNWKTQKGGQPCVYLCR